MQRIMMPNDGMWTNNSDSKPKPVSHYPDGSKGETNHALSTYRTQQSSFDAYRNSILSAPLMGSMSEHPFSEADLMDTGNPRINRLSILRQNRLNPIGFNSGSDDLLPYRIGQRWHDVPEQNTHARMVEHLPGKVVPNTNKVDSSRLSSPKDMLQNIGGRSVVRKPETANVPREIDMNLPFPVKLHYILSHPDYQQYVTWLPHGRAWRILKPKWFEETVIPKFFRSDKYASFMRQVNGWAFIRITEGADLNAYYHEMFLRGLPNLCAKMKRPPKVKSAAAAARNSSGADSGIPDFNRISKIAPLPPATPCLPDRDLPSATTLLQKSGDEDGSSVGSNSNTSLHPWIGGDSIAAIDMAIEVSGSAQHMPLVDWSPPSDTWEESNENDPLKSQEDGSDKLKEPEQQESSDEAVRREAQNSPEDAGGSAAPSSQPQEPGGQLSVADMTYLAHQNRILLKHAKQVERRPIEHLHTPSGSQSPGATHMESV